MSFLCFNSREYTFCLYSLQISYLPSNYCSPRKYKETFLHRNLLLDHKQLQLYGPYIAVFPGGLHLVHLNSLRKYFVMWGFFIFFVFHISFFRSCPVHTRTFECQFSVS